MQKNKQINQLQSKQLSIQQDQQKQYRQAVKDAQKQKQQRNLQQTLNFFQKDTQTTITDKNLYDIISYLRSVPGKNHQERQDFLFQQNTIPEETLKPKHIYILYEPRGKHFRFMLWLGKEKTWASYLHKYIIFNPIPAKQGKQNVVHATYYQRKDLDPLLEKVYDCFSTKQRQDFIKVLQDLTEKRKYQQRLSSRPPVQRNWIW